MFNDEFSYCAVFCLDFDLHLNCIHNVVQKLRRNYFDASLKITRLQLFH